MTTIDTQSNVTESEDIDVFVSDKIETPEEVALASRIDMYAILADAYRYPDELTRAYVRNGEFRSHLIRIMGGLPYVVELSDEEQELLVYSNESSDDDVEAEFIRLFEAGPGTPPCPLVEGLHLGKEDGRISIFKDLILFYNNFGLSYAEGSSAETPDHITYELEFLHYMAFLELKAHQKGNDVLPLQKAQKEFIERHPAKWIGIMADQVKSLEADLRDGINKGSVAFYRNVMVLTDRFIKHDLNYLTKLIEN